MAARDELDRSRRIHKLSGPVPKDAAGRPLCRWCGKPVPPPKRTVCSQACVHEIRMRTDQGYARNRVYERDKGRCALCGVDTDRLARIARRLQSIACFEHRMPGGQWAPHPSAARRLVQLEQLLAIICGLGTSWEIPRAPAGGWGGVDTLT